MTGYRLPPYALHSVSTPTVIASAVNSRSQWKIVFFLAFFALTIFAAYEKNARILDPMSPIAQHYAPAKWYLPVHAIFGILAMGLAAFLIFMILVRCGAGSFCALGQVSPANRSTASPNRPYSATFENDIEQTDKRDCDGNIRPPAEN